MEWGNRQDSIDRSRANDPPNNVTLIKLEGNNSARRQRRYHNTSTLVNCEGGINPLRDIKQMKKASRLLSI